jgi:hypothetical protein
MATLRKDLLVAARLVGLQVGDTRKGSFEVDGHCATIRHSSAACEGFEGLRRVQRGLEVILGGKH